jgi:hypothetical protein
LREKQEVIFGLERQLGEARPEEMSGKNDI